MKIDILEIVGNDPRQVLPAEVLSLRPFINYLKNIIKITDKYRGHFLLLVLEKLKAQENSLQSIDIQDAKKYSELLELIYITLSPVLEDDKTYFQALSMPVNATVFYSNEAFFNLMTDPEGKLRKNMAYKNSDELRLYQEEFCYSLILEEYYNLSNVFHPIYAYAVENESSGLVSTYRINIDSRFIEVHTSTALPELTIDFFEPNIDKEELLIEVKKLLPLDLFRFEGFCIINLVEITAQHAIKSIKDQLLNRSSLESNPYCPEIVESLKTLVGSKTIQFGMFPILKLNNKLVFNESICANSILINLSQQLGLDEEAYLYLTNNYLSQPKLIFLHESTTADNNVYLKLLRANGVKSYALMPIFFNNVMVGIMEIYTMKDEPLNKQILSKLEPVIPFLSQLFQKAVNDFNSNIEKVIKENFTLLQPSVQWKFNETAWHYLRDFNTKDGVPEIENIGFEKVHPLYGAIDIKNSTIERNEALQKDLTVQFSLLIKLLNQLKSKTGFGLIDEKIFSSQRWFDLISTSYDSVQETKLNDFLENDIEPFLIHFRDGEPALVPSISKYFSALNEQSGIASEHRRKLENSMNTVISTVNNYMETMRNEIQQAYPCFFETFRTDGVEYDIYIGQSIAPDKPFSDIYLKNLRLLQIKSMAAIAKQTHSLLSELFIPVETTQLIFIHSKPIDIKFRKDEKRFDVEGSYNIRYQIIKKRIDKVRISGTKERLTIPNKIALAYFNEKDADEYITYIRYLQQEKVLMDDLEYLELEAVQGISGLKALRVGVMLD